MLMNLQTSITAIQQRAAQTNANITRLNELFDTRIPPPLKEESEAEEDPHAQPIMIEDPNNPRRLIVHQNPRIVMHLLQAGHPLQTRTLLLSWPRWSNLKNPLPK
ncbi:hypothetical protein RHMOL_Rhmol13G0179000 [Rhododendron molle]|uniref:Uncharacterized protein n=1 Tax=Rhododendron molle TaxID=49168 RepID=A0ACC0L8C6_RHOML|nr:hypothetical protein RHMOL_Rhmol13G0179000 [Rhododendron molle]